MYSPALGRLGAGPTENRAARDQRYRPLILAADKRGQH